MIKYISVDDEHIAHDIIEGYCALLPNMKLQKKCYDALEAFEYLNTHHVDLVFLDLNMPKLKGFEFLRTLKNPPQVIVTTAYKEFALEGYELNISDYLLKPFGFERFLKAVNKALGASNIQTISTQNDRAPKRIFFKSGRKYIQLELGTILFIEALGNYTKVVTTKEGITVREKLSDVLHILPQEGFLQVHKSFIVAKSHIDSIEGNRIAISEYIIPIGKVYKQNINHLLR